jgi:hypothetical protein
LVKATRLDDAEPELVKAFVAGKLFFREHEVTTDAISVLADTTSVLHLCLNSAATSAWRQRWSRRRPIRCHE